MSIVNMGMAEIVQNLKIPSEFFSQNKRKKAQLKVI